MMVVGPVFQIVLRLEYTILYYITVECDPSALTLAKGTITLNRYYGGDNLLYSCDDVYTKTTDPVCTESGNWSHDPDCETIEVARNSYLALQSQRDGLIGVVVVLVLAVVTLGSIILYLKRSSLPCRDTPSDKQEVYEEPVSTRPSNSANPPINTYEQLTISPSSAYEQLELNTTVPLYENRQEMTSPAI
ncbi:hypothetical protein EB796_002687 [Bugula neritina]|uniref:Sushi domain-containing protein n=1 Tax=Bugula neritina TaxID=10212 RepID=A0A7J7KK09_BUGNE|nr:hypothetical protein EB796_002687 [Bugula neritina]